MSVSDLQATYWPGGRLPSDGHLALWGTDDLAGVARQLGLSPGEPAVLPTVVPAGRHARRTFVAADVPAQVVPIRAAVRMLAALPPRHAWPSWQRPSDSLLAWSVAAKLALELTAAGHLVPAVRPAGPGLGVACCRTAVATDDGRLAALADAMPVAAHALLRDEDDDTIWSPIELLTAFCDATADACARPVPTSSAVGVASPSPQGQAMFSTATAALNAPAEPAHVSAC